MTWMRFSFIYLSSLPPLILPWIRVQNKQLLNKLYVGSFEIKRDSKRVLKWSSVNKKSLKNWSFHSYFHTHKIWIKTIAYTELPIRPLEVGLRLEKNFTGLFTKARFIKSLCEMDFRDLFSQRQKRKWKRNKLKRIIQIDQSSKKDEAFPHTT